jgi:hypothetical protein
MRDNLLDAVATVVRMVRGAYTWSEALSYAEVQYNLDEFQAEDLPRLARGQYKRLQEQTS